MDDNQVAKLILTGDTVLNNPTNIKDGGSYILIVQQNDIGHHVLAYGSDYHGRLLINTDPNKKTILTFVADDTDMMGVKQAYE